MKVPSRAPAWRSRAVAALRSPWFRGLVTLALLAVVAAQIDWATMEHRIEVGRPGWAIAAVGLIISALAVGALRWQLLLRAAGLRLRAAEVGRVYAVSTFSSTFLPTSVGGDVARAFLVARRGPELARAGITVLVDRAAAFAGLNVVALVAWAVAPGDVPGSQGHSLLVVAAFCVAISGVVVVLLVRPPSFVRRRLSARLSAPLRDLRGLCAACARRPQLGAAVLVTSVVFQALIVLQLCAIAEAFAIEISFVAVAVAFTLVTLAILMPVSIGGFGIREGSYVVLLGASGVSATDATLISLSTVAVLFLASLPGAVLLVRHGTRPALGAA